MATAASLTLRRWALAAVGLLASMHAFAQYTSDIDIYAGTPSAGAAPNVLIILDNTGNWSSPFPSEKEALITAFNALDLDRFRVGLMMFTETGGNDSGEGGGYVRAALRLLDADYKTKLNNLLTSLDVNADKGNSGKAGLAMAEAYAYLSGGTPFAGNNKGKTDYAGNAGGTAASNAIYALNGNALLAKAATTYQPPAGAVCARNYIIYISNNAAQDSNSDNEKASQLLSAAYAAAGMTRPAEISITPNGSQSNKADEWARFMNASGLAVTTFTLDVNKVTTGQGPGWSALLKSMAAEGGGQYFDVSTAAGPGQVLSALNNVFNQIQAVNSVFSSASLPVSVNARGTYLNQVFMGMFRPDGDANPRWRGNLKQYQFNYDPATDSLYLAGANSKPAISGSTGFVAPDAVSYWTQPSTFWSEQKLGTPPSASDSPDGEVVEKGGVAQMIRNAYPTSQATRKVYTCVGCAADTNLSVATSAAFSTTNSSNLTAISSDTTERNAIINWVRGTDNAGDESGPGGTTTIRPSVHGDVLHSRPAVVNYGTEAKPNVVVFYGSNDGYLRAINGNQTGDGAGTELWGFIPEEHFGKLKRLRANSPEIRLSTTSVLPTATNPPTPRDYFVDGPISVYQKVDSSGATSKVYLYFAMRRGGRFLYALDVTDPAQPKFLWRKSSADTGFGILGQTWSEPRITKLRGYTSKAPDGSADPVIVMGAGYDATAEDTANPGTTTMGNAVLVLNARTGEKVAQFNTERSVAADVTLVDSDYDGYVDRGYAVDLGGNIYRIDFETANSTALKDWGIYKLAALKGSGLRKFFYAPDVVLTKTFTAVQVGSGDREKPLLKTTTDAFFTVFDDTVGKGTVADFTPLTPSDLGVVGSDANMAHGCYINMDTAGEKVVNAALSFRGVTYFGTNKPTPPAANTCSANLGQAKTYSVPLFCRAPTSSVLNGGGLPPSPVAGFVTITYEQTNADGTTKTVTKQKDFVIGAPNSKKSGIETGKTTATLNVPRKRRYWYQENAR